ncbi:metalloregulator ArsR/SmtB family transcription factor [Dehalobacter sp. DCM]|nr:metalloregulator ArsR/SmtB family transcription factor [Dehalobacter sp. DCM]
MKMIKIIGSKPKHTMTVSDIAAILGISQPAATNHLKILHAADLVERTRIGTSVFYSLNNDAVADYKQLMEHAFIKAYTPCPNNFQCNECEYAETCY